MFKEHSLSNAISNTLQDISIQIYQDDLDLYGHTKRVSPAVFKIIGSGILMP